MFQKGQEKKKKICTTERLLGLEPCHGPIVVSILCYELLSVQDAEEETWCPHHPWQKDWLCVKMSKDQGKENKKSSSAD